MKDAKFPFAIAWIEEMAEFKTEDEVKTITNSLLRGELDKGVFYKFFYSYNPPKRKQSWVNKKNETITLAKNTIVHPSTYLHNPYISKEFKAEALATKERNEKRYKSEYLGEAIGSGVAPFENLEFRTITDEEIASFDNIRQGNDFGYANDPDAFVHWHYDKTRRIIYAMDEIYEVKFSNRKLAERLIDREYHTTITVVDSSEPKSRDELEEHGVKVKAAKKAQIQ